MKRKQIVWFSEVDKEDINIVGGKGANLGEMVRVGIPVPNGFIVTAQAYFGFLEQTKLKLKIKAILKDVDVNDPQALKRVSDGVKNLILKTKMPSELAHAIMRYYIELGKISGSKHKGLVKKLKVQLSQPLVAIRSSATAEDLPTASFAGQQATFLNIRGEANVVEAVKKCWASLFEARAIFYRKQQGFDHFKVGIAVPVQRMVQSDASGITFTVDPITGNKKIMVIEAIYGLGEYIVGGIVTPDHYQVDKTIMHIVKKKIAQQEKQLTMNKGKTKNVTVKRTEQEKQKITDKQILEIAKIGKKIEKHYYFPQDIEWAIEDGIVSIVQTRPITTLKDTKKRKDSTIADLKKHKVLLKGNPASPGIASGPVRFVHSAKEVAKVRPGEVLVAPQTDPDYVPAMKKASAILTERGGRTSHAAIVSRELGIPAVVGAKGAMTELKHGQIITIEGETGTVYDGGVVSLPKAEKPKEGKRVKTATKVYVNLAEPSIADRVSERNVDGIGLLRAEFMVARIGVHPRKLIKDKKQKVFVDKLSEQLGTFCKAFSPRPVVYRTTDFKTNEYRNLKGGKEFEPEEPNPMLGFRGASRYIADPEVFMMELEAIKYIRNKKKLRNLWVMIPFVRTPEELIKVKKVMASSGLSRSASFKLWMMVELPVNVISLEDFIKVGIDGVSIGSNDLTMLIMGTDRDNSEVAHVFNERNKAVQWALERVVKTCHKHKITTSICGQAPSDYPEMVENLVSWGITSVSVNPDAIERTRDTIYHAERKLISR